jgi:hypothetical protein
MPYLREVAGFPVIAGFPLATVLKVHGHNRREPSPERRYCRLRPCAPIHFDFLVARARVRAWETKKTHRGTWCWVDPARRSGRRSRHGNSRKSSGHYDLYSVTKRPIAPRTSIAITASPGTLLLKGSRPAITPCRVTSWSWTPIRP